MLSRTDVLRRVFEIRKSIYNKEQILEMPPSIEDIKIRKEIDRLIKDIIGDFLSSSDRDIVDKIVLKAICGEISIDMAVVAIKEIVLTYYTKEDKNESSIQVQKEHLSEKKLTAYYQKRYR